MPQAEFLDKCEGHTLGIRGLAIIICLPIALLTWRYIFKYRLLWSSLKCIFPQHPVPRHFHICFFFFIRATHGPCFVVHRALTIGILDPGDYHYRSTQRASIAIPKTPSG